jgi:2-methylcitrate dehydratase PrpD
VRVRVEPGIEARYPREWPARVRVRLANGESLGAETAYPKGDPENPLSRSEIEDKFSTLAAFGGFEAAAEGYREWVRSLSERSTARLP